MATNAESQKPIKQTIETDIFWLTHVSGHADIFDEGSQVLRLSQIMLHKCDFVSSKTAAVDLCWLYCNSNCYLGEFTIVTTKTIVITNVVLMTLKVHWKKKQLHFFMKKTITLDHIKPTDAAFAHTSPVRHYTLPYDTPLWPFIR